MLSEIVKRLVPCLNPRRVRNPYTGEYLVCRCGKCAQCLNIKAFSAQKSCENESSSHRFTFFVTLKYAEPFLPRIKVVDHFDDFTGRFDEYGNPIMLTTTPLKDHVFLIDDCDRSPSYGSRIMSYPHKDIYDVQRRRYNPFKKYQSPIAYCLTSDLQKYIKRLRFSIYKETGEFIRYFAVSDYGGKFLRPHFHILFYFNKTETLKIFRQYSISKWRFGSVDSQKSRGYCGSYVSSYVTGASFNVPLLSTHWFKTRSFHSVRFGFQSLMQYRSDVYSSPSLPFDGNCYELPYGLAKFYSTPSLHRAFYPKIYRFSELSFDDLLKLYTLRYTVCDGDMSVTYKEFVSRLCHYVNSSYLWLSNKIIDLLGLDDDFVCLCRLSQVLDSRLKSIFSIGGHFHRFICDNDPSYHEFMVHNIIMYYEDYDRHKWYKFLSSLEANSEFMTYMGDNIYLAYPLSYVEDKDTFESYKKMLFDQSSYLVAADEACNYLQHRVKHRESTDILISKQESYV